MHPLGEGGKLKLTTDCTTLEFAVSQLLGDYKLNLASLDGEFKALRAFRFVPFTVSFDSLSKHRAFDRPLLFSDTPSLADPGQTRDLPVQILYHHLLVRGSLPLPHEMHKWQEAEYCKFVSEHSEVENRRLVEGALKEWESKGRPGGDGEAGDCAAVLKSVIEREKQKAIPAGIAVSTDP